MGHAQSNEQPGAAGGEAHEDGTELALEGERDEEKAGGSPSDGERESRRETDVNGNSEESGDRTPEPEESDRGESHTAPEAETGNLGDGVHCSAESACSTAAEPSRSESTEERLARVGEEAARGRGYCRVRYCGPGWPPGRPQPTAFSRARRHREEDLFLFISDFAAPSSHLPTVSGETQTAQEVSSPGQEETTAPSHTDQTHTRLDSLASLSDGTGEARREEEEEGESVTSSGTEPEPRSSPNDDATEAVHQEPSLGPSPVAPESDGPPGAAGGQDKGMGESEGSKLKEDGTSGSEVTELDPAMTPTAQGDEVHRDTAPPDTHVEEEEEEKAKVEEVHVQSTCDCGPEVPPDTGATAEVVSVTGGDSEPESLPAVAEQSGEDGPEQTVDRPSLEAEVKEGSERTDSEPAADEIVAPCAPHGHSETAVPEAMHETADPESPATPVTCGLATPSVAGITSLTDPAHNSTPGLERVEESPRTPRRARLRVETCHAPLQWKRTPWAFQQEMWWTVRENWLLVRGQTWGTPSSVERKGRALKITGSGRWSHFQRAGESVFPQRAVFGGGGGGGRGYERRPQPSDGGRHTASIHGRPARVEAGALAHSARRLSERWRGSVAGQSTGDLS
ncbi:hypothetical protein AAFF_G00105120 [Aldrovandia affinis]|uniref:Uncharacterized protein n=1 Tax=Aldrovandia affinis TaxID=143900 RepID=A0AAD7T2C9_9TELE|nr:hypothetical protein AAFF_G00105120 [Aldrovandia affinis]